MKVSTSNLAALALALSVSVALTGLAGCGGEEPAKTSPKASGSPAAGAPPGQGGPSPQGTASAGPSPTAGMPPLPKRDFQERDFAESESNRDPFRGFAADLAQQYKKTFTVQRRVLVDRYTLEELKLVALVIGAPSRALLIDPSNLGWIAKVGDFVGKPELVHSGGPSGTDVPINWRVDRIRNGDIVFIREDPSHPEIPPTTRVIALRNLEEVATNRTQGITVVGGQ